MGRGTKPRLLVLSLALAPILGCGGGGGGNGALFASGNLPTVETFLDDFSGEFPGENWVVKEGAAAIDPDQGNPAPGLSMSAGEEARVRSAFVFSTAGPLTLSVDIGIPGFEAGQLGRARIEIGGESDEDDSDEEDSDEQESDEDDSDEGESDVFESDDEESDGAEASAEIRLEDGIIVVKISGMEVEVPFEADADFHALTFSLDADQTATWSLDGVVVATLANFPVALARIELETDDGSTATFVFDNVSLTRPDGGGGGGGGDAGVETFADDFSGDFPGDSWIAEEGDAAINADQGNPAPGLALGPSDEEVEVRSAFTFSTADPLTLSIDVGTPGFAAGQTGRFEFGLERACMGDGEASIEIRLDEGEIRVEILDSEVTLPFDADAAFHTVTFTVADDGTATWSIDGTEVLSAADFPDGQFRIELEADEEGTAGFVVDNVSLTRP